MLKQIAVAELQPDETVDAVREARLLAKVGVVMANALLGVDVTAMFVFSLIIPIL